MCTLKRTIKKENGASEKWWSGDVGLSFHLRWNRVQTRRYKATSGIEGDVTTFTHSSIITKLCCVTHSLSTESVAETDTVCSCHRPTFHLESFNVLHVASRCWLWFLFTVVIDPLLCTFRLGVWFGQRLIWGILF